MPDEEQRSPSDTAGPPPDFCDDGSSAEQPTSSGHRSVRARISQSFIEHTEPAPIPRAWQFLKADEDVRHFPLGHHDFLRSLQNEFTDGQLERARILSPHNETQTYLNAVLISSPLVIERENGRIIDVTTDVGTLWRKDPPALRLALERRPSRHLPRDLFVAESAAVPLLRQLRLRVTTMSGLDQLSGQQMRKLFGRQTDREAPFFRPILVGWDLPNMESALTEFARRVLQQFYDWQTASGYNPDQNFLHLWFPQGDQFGQIGAAVRLQDRQLIKTKIRESVSVDTKSAVDYWQSFLDARKLDLATVATELRHIVASESRLPRRRDAGVAVKRVRQWHSALTHNYYLAADAARDSTDALLWLALVREHDDLLKGDPFLNAAEQIAMGERPSLPKEMDNQTADLRDRQIARVLRLIKALNRRGS